MSPRSDKTSPAAASTLRPLYRAGCSFLFSLQLNPGCSSCLFLTRGKLIAPVIFQLAENDSSSQLFKKHLGDFQLSIQPPFKFNILVSGTSSLRSLRALQYYGWSVYRQIKRLNLGIPGGKKEHFLNPNDEKSSWSFSSLVMSFFIRWIFHQYRRLHAY